MKIRSGVLMVLCLAVLGGCYEFPRPPQDGRPLTMDEQRRLANDEWFRQNTQRSTAFPGPSPWTSPMPSRFP